jgi:hypothetical protein
MHGMTRIRQIWPAIAVGLTLVALMASPAAAEEFVAGPVLKATGNTLEWTAVPEATKYDLYYAKWTEYPYAAKKMEVTGLSATPPVALGETIHYYVKAVAPSSYLSNSIYLAYDDFAAETFPETSKSHGTDPQGFQVTGSVSVCKKATFEGVATATSQTLEVHPKYEECEVELAGTFKAKVNTEGCNYLFHIAPRSSTINSDSNAPTTAKGSTDVVCQAGKEIKVEVEGLEGGCQIKVPAQTGLKSVEYVNEGSGSSRKVSVNANVTGIKWSATGACGLKESSGTNGEYKEGKIGGLGIPELGSGPATALSEGFTETEGADGAWIG